jgi:hypothetical protein
VEHVEVVIARQQHNKHISVATDIDAATEDPVFSMWSMPRLYTRPNSISFIERVAKLPEF